MPRFSSNPRESEMSLEGVLYSAALATALNADSHPAERAGANKLMRELAEEMKFDARRTRMTPERADFAELISETIMQRVEQP